MGEFETGGRLMLSIRPSTLHESNAYVTEYHRHHKPVRGCRFCIAVVDENGSN